MLEHPITSSASDKTRAIVPPGVLDLRVFLRPAALRNEPFGYPRTRLLLAPCASISRGARSHVGSGVPYALRHQLSRSPNKYLPITEKVWGDRFGPITKAAWNPAKPPVPPS